MKDADKDKVFLIDVYGDRLVVDKANKAQDIKNPKDFLHIIADKMMSAFSKDAWASLFDWCKENLTTAVLLISALGSIVQIYHLAKINLAYVKFFSITQLIADGSLILVTVITATIFYKIQAPLFESDFRKKIAINIEKTNLLNPISSYIVLAFFLTYPFTLISVAYRLKIEWLWVSPVISTILIASNIVFIYFTISYVRKYYNFLKTTSDQFKFKKTSMLVCNFVLLMTMISTVLFSTKVVFVYLEGYSSPFNLINYENVKKKTEDDYGKLKSYELLYFNDTYMFISIEQQDSDLKRTVIYKTQDVFFK